MGEYQGGYGNVCPVLKNVIMKSKIIKDRINGTLIKCSDEKRIEDVRYWIEMSKETGITPRFVFSTKTAYKSRKNSLAKLAAQKQRILKQRYLIGDKSVRIKNAA